MPRTSARRSWGFPCVHVQAVNAAAVVLAAYGGPVPRSVDAEPLL